MGQSTNSVYFGSAAETAPVALVGLDGAGHIIAANARARAQLRRTERELLGADFFALVEASSPTSGPVRRALDRATAFEALMRCGDGKLRTFAWEATPLAEGGAVLAGGPLLEIAKSAPDRRVRLDVVLARIHGIMLRNTDLAEMLSELLGEVLSVFECDRAWLLFPCDPGAPAWHVPMERTVPRWPGAMAIGEDIPTTPEVAALLQRLLDSGRPLAFGPGADEVPDSVREAFGVKSQLLVGIYPKIGRPWILGLHHCDRAQVYGEEEREIFDAIGKRLADSLSLLIALRDLREREAHLGELVAARTAELSRLNRDLESFSGAVSHDLRAPLRAITRFADLLDQDYASLLDDDGRTVLGHIRQGCTQMRALIDDLLMLTKASGAELSREQVDLSALARDIAAAFEAKDGGRAVEWAIAEGMVAHGDPGLLRIVMSNLLGNAWKFTSKTANARIEVGSRREGEATVFFVRDNGAGFDASLASSLFLPLKRLHSAVEFPGTGVGLNTVRRIIDRHGGRVFAEGAVGEGATFSFTLGG